MKLKIICPAGYGDRYGVFHERNSIAELPDAIAHKLIHHGIATEVAPVEAAMMPQPQPRKPGRPRKAVFPEE